MRREESEENDDDCVSVTHCSDRLRADRKGREQPPGGLERVHRADLPGPASLSGACRGCDRAGKQLESSRSQWGLCRAYAGRSGTALDTYAAARRCRSDRSL